MNQILALVLQVATAAGGSVEELRAVLDLDAEQVRNLKSFFDRAEQQYDEVRKAFRDQGGQAALDKEKAWEEKVREDVKKLLKDTQRGRYSEWLAFKRRLASEYDKALFGIPMVTELKLRLDLGSDSVKRLQRISDDGIDRIQARVKDLKNAKAPVEEIAKAVNEIRKSTIESMIEASTDQKKLKEFVKAWLQAPEAKLAKADKDRLGRLMKTLAIDGDLEKRIRAKIAAILMHQADVAALRKGLGKELLMLVLRTKAEAEVWEAFHEHSALIGVHEKRLKSLYEDLKADLPTKQIAKLVSEGIVE